MAIAENKSERIEVRTTSTLKALLQRAAASSHKNVTEFLLEAGINAAEDALVDRRIFRLDDRQWQASPQRCNTSDPAFYGPPGRGDRVGSDADKVALVVRRPLPATCADCGADVLAHADIEGPGAAGPAGVQRDADPEGAAMTLRFIVAVRDRVPVGEEAPA